MSLHCFKCWIPENFLRRFHDSGRQFDFAKLLNEEEVKKPPHLNSIRPLLNKLLVKLEAEGDSLEGGCHGECVGVAIFCQYGDRAHCARGFTGDHADA